MSDTEIDRINESLSDERKVRLEIAKNIFDEVLEANLHQSEIAARLLIPVAFLTAATVSLFRFFVDKNISVEFMGINIISILFVLYIIFTVGGILVFFEVIGPSFFMVNWPTSTERQKGPKSALFFKFIAETSIDKWISYFHETKSGEPKRFLGIDELQDKLIYDYTAESSLLAKKAQGKVKDNLFGHLFFYPSFCSLLLMTSTGVLRYLDASHWLIFGFGVPIVCFFGYIEIQVFKKYKKEAKKYRKGLRKRA